ncbi:MAG TPA: hypothetical protein VF647_25515 [Longimicrobium sp.]
MYDRFGDIYPDHTVPITEAEFRATHEGGPLQYLRLSSVFRARRAAFRLNPNGVEGGSWRTLVASIGDAPPAEDTSFEAEWSRVQNALRGRVARQVRTITESGGGARRPLIVLVHGFNNNKSEASAWYTAARKEIERRLPDPAYLEVYWDGLSTSAPPAVWGAAQYNFPLVGLEFRRLLNEIDPAVPIRVLTHSSGGPLLANAMGDASDPLDSTVAGYERYRERARGDDPAYRIPNRADFRVGMVAPAAAPNTFARFATGATGPDRLILGINPSDVALTKAFLPCTALGDTCINRPPLVCRDVLDRFPTSGRTRLYLFDFSKSLHNGRYMWFWDDHAMTVYLCRDDMKPFLDVLLSEQPSTPGETAQICPSAS